MIRGMVKLTNKELDLLRNTLIESNCDKQSLIDKLASEDESLTQDTEFDVLISLDEAEIMLDCMSVPDKDDDHNLVTARIKIQKFITP